MRLFASQVENYKFKNAAFEAAGRVFGRMNKIPAGTRNPD
jgi:hypothetical protein